jgi:uncharacterized protein (DUF1501 family)
MTLVVKQRGTCLHERIESVPGPHDCHPNLTNLDESSDLVCKVDLRSVYSEVLGRWFGVDTRKILEGSFEPADIIRPKEASA